MTKIMANQYVEKGNFKRIMDLLKHMGKKVKLDVPKEKSSKVVWTVEDTMQETSKKPVSQMTPAEKKKDAERRKEYNAYQKSKRNESIELDEAIDYFKVSKELSDYAKKHGGPDKIDFEKAAAYVREIGKNSAVSVQDKAGKGLNMLFKNADTDVRDRMQIILTKGGFKIKGGYVMRESTAAYGKSLADIRNKRKKAAIKPQDRHTLKKLSDLMKRANEDAVEEKYRKPTQAEIDADRKKDKKPKDSSDRYSNMKKKMYGNAMENDLDEAKAPGKLGPNASREDKINHTMKIMKMYPANKGKSEKELRKGATDYIDQFTNKNKRDDAYIAKMSKSRLAKSMMRAKKESVELDEKTKWKMGDGRPRNGPRIENDRFWNLPYDSLKYIAKDAGEAMKANPTARKATTGPGNWADQVADAATVMQWRKKNGIKESVELDEQKMDQKMFDSLKKGDKLSVSFGSGIRKDNNVTLQVKSKSKSAKYNLEKINCVNVQNPGGMKYTIYNRQGKFSLAQGDMGTHGADFVKESVDEASILKTTHKNVTNKKSVEKDRKKAVKTYQDIRKGKYSGVKMANEEAKKAHQYYSTSEKSMKGGHRSKLVGPKGVTYVGSVAYKTAAAAKGEADAYHDGYFNTPSKPNNDKAAMNRVHDYRKKHATKLVNNG